MPDTSMTTEPSVEWDIEIIEAEDIDVGDDEVGILLRSSTSCTSC